jgi:hypothetical protein
VLRGCTGPGKHQWRGDLIPSDIVSKFDTSREYVRWARDAIKELQATLSVFVEQSGGGIVIEKDPKTGIVVEKLRFSESIPGGLRRRATESLLHCRHAFDQATFTARNIVSGRSNDSIYYPWAQTPVDLERRLSRLDEQLRDVFRKHEPYPRSDAYPGGNDVIRALARLANNKHTVGLSIIGRILSMKHPEIKGSLDLLEIGLPKWDPEKGEATLMRWKGDAEVTGHYDFEFEVVLDDPCLPMPVNAIGGLTDFAAMASHVIETLQAACLSLASRT